MWLNKSSAEYPNDPAKQAVVDRYNKMFVDKRFQEADWGEMFAEFIAAYFEAKK